MKKAILVFASFLCVLNALAQDILLDKAGPEQLVRITEITADSVLYREISDTLALKTYGVSKNQLLMITHSTGLKEIFQASETVKAGAAPAVVPLTSTEYYTLGETEARQNIKARGMFWGTFGVTCIPFVGPAAAIYSAPVISLIPPSKAKITALKPEYLQNAEYIAGYRRQARKKKFGRAAAGFGLGLIPCTAFMFTYMIKMLNH